MGQGITVSPLEGGEPESWQITIARRDFADFIKGLLGQPRSVEQEYQLTFKIDHDWISDLDHIIDQRITNQHDASLVDFSCKFFFADGQIYTVTTKDAFRNFGTKSDVLSNGIEIIWTYLVKFPGKTIPEKQEILFSAKTESARRKDLPKILAFDIPFPDPGLLRVKIMYTELTWGQDLLTHISSKIQRNFKRLSIIQEYVRPLTILFAPIVWFLSLVSLFAIPELTRHTAVQHSREQVLLQVNKATEFSDLVLKKLDYLMQEYLVSTSFFSLPNMAAFAGIILFNVAIFLFIIRRSRNFVILNEKTKIAYEDYKGRQRNQFIAALITFTLGVASSIAANQLGGWLKF